MTIVFNASAMEQQRAQDEAAMNAQASAMESTKATYEAQAAQLESEASSLESQAAAQDAIAASAMKTEYYTDSEGKSRSRSVPDMAKRAAARAQATSLRAQAAEKRQQAADLRQQAAALAAAISALREAVAVNNAYMLRLMEIVQDTDLSYAQMLAEIIEETAAFTDKMNKLRDSFNDNFPLNSGMLSGLDKMMENSLAAGGQIMSELAGKVLSCVYGGDPINMATGNFIYDKDDIEIPGRFPLVFKRFYNSIDETDGILGKNWTHNFNIKLVDKKEAVHISFDDGHTETYHLFEDEMYLAPMDHLNLLRKTDDGYMLAFPTMERYFFDRDGKLTSILDLNGNQTSLTHKNGLLEQVSTDCGSLFFTYNENRRITKIIDHTGRTVTYGYSGNLLTSATHPSGAVFRYEYGNDGKLSNIINPLGITVIQNEYDENFRTVSQSFADGGAAFLSYDDTNMMTTATEQNGNVVRYFRDEKYRTTRIAYDDGGELFGYKDEDGNLECHASEERFEYNDNNKRTLHADRNGNIRRFEYDIRGNMTKHRDPVDNIVLMEYNSLNKPVKITNPDGGVISFTYDEKGNLISFLDPLERAESPSLGSVLLELAKVTVIKIIS